VRRNLDQHVSPDKAASVIALNSYVEFVSDCYQSQQHLGPPDQIDNVGWSLLGDALIEGTDQPRIERVEPHTARNVRDTGQQFRKQVLADGEDGEMVLPADRPRR
jgi:hypothetical protein